MYRTYLFLSSNETMNKTMLNDTELSYLFCRKQSPGESLTQSLCTKVLFSCPRKLDRMKYFVDSLETFHNYASLLIEFKKSIKDFEEWNMKYSSFLPRNHIRLYQDRHSKFPTVQYKSCIVPYPTIDAFHRGCHQGKGHLEDLIVIRHDRLWQKKRWDVQPPSHDFSFWKAIYFLRSRTSSVLWRSCFSSKTQSFCFDRGRHKRCCRFKWVVIWSLRSHPR